MNENHDEYERSLQATVADEESADPLSADGAEPEDEPSDPFAAWPEAESADLSRTRLRTASRVQHSAGEIDVPDGYTVLEGTPSGHRRTVAIVVSRFNGNLTNRMLASAIDALEEAGVAQDSVTIVPVPGAFELPLAAMALAKTRRYACVVALGAVVRGETPHFEYRLGRGGLRAAAGGDRDRRARGVRRSHHGHGRAGRGADRPRRRGGAYRPRDGRRVRAAARQLCAAEQRRS